MLFCENETNHQRLYGADPTTPYPKDGINDHVVGGASTVNPAQTGTKAALHHVLTLEPGATSIVTLTLSPSDSPPPDRTVVDDRRAEADEFYAALTPGSATPTEAIVLRQACAGLLWCKQLGAEPVLAVFAGYVLNGDSMRAGSPEMAIYTQEALEEIEYVMGPATSKWGKKRAEDGFPEPFPLHYVEIGNEDWFDRYPGGYDKRFTEMATAIRKKYPQLKIISTAPVKGFKPDLYAAAFK